MPLDTEGHNSKLDLWVTPSALSWSAAKEERFNQDKVSRVIDAEFSWVETLISVLFYHLSECVLRSPFS